MNKNILTRCIYVAAIALLAVSFAFAGTELDTQLYSTGYPYAKYYLDRAVTSSENSGDTNKFTGMTRSFQIDLGGHDLTQTAIINFGASAYDQTILGQISLTNSNKSTILDTFVSYWGKLTDVNNPVFYCGSGYTDGSGAYLRYGPMKIIRIKGRDSVLYPDWWDTWDWAVDTGAAATIILYACDGYRRKGTTNYKILAKGLADNYIARLHDTDGGVRFGPVHMDYPGNWFYWNMKSTEQNERLMYAFEALYATTGEAKYNTSANNIKSWLKSMYDFTEHLFHASATYNGSSWDKAGFGYMPSDVIAMAPLEMMFSDTYFGTTQADRNAEVDAMFTAIEARTAYFDSTGKPKFFKFCTSQWSPPDYGSVEFSSQMAIAYLKAAQQYNTQGLTAKTQYYLDRYNNLLNHLSTFFTAPAGDANSSIAPYGSKLDGSVAYGGTYLLPTGTGIWIYNCQGALASAYYAFTKAGYDPLKMGGGTGIPQTDITLNMSLPYNSIDATYNSSGAAACQMILNYIRAGAGQSQLTQNEIYQYAKSPAPLTGDLTADEVDKALGHFDPYDALVSNWADGSDSLADGNPYQGYNYSVEAFNPSGDPDAQTKYMRDICHWMAYTVTKEDWWNDGELVACPNTPAAVPIYGSYSHWVAVKGFAVSQDPCPNPHTDPFNTPAFTVYGYWIKDPLTTGLGQDTYKTAAECQATYFLPVTSSDSYNGKYIQIAEPPLQNSSAKINVEKFKEDAGNLEYVGAEPEAAAASLNSKMLNSTSASTKSSSVAKTSWKDVIDSHVSGDPAVTAAFEGTKCGTPLLVKRLDKDNADYYLAPFGSSSSNGFMAKGIIILDASTGAFKELSWSGTAELFPKLSSQWAAYSIRSAVTAYFLNKLYGMRLNRRSYGRNYYSEASLVNAAYKKLINYISAAKYELVWEPSGISQSPYRPYWKFDANGYIFYVNQDGQVTSETALSTMMSEIVTNLKYLKRYF